MAFNWINPHEYPFDSLLLMERFQIRLMLDLNGWLNDKDKWIQSIGLALRANQHVKWYLMRRCPERGARISQLADSALRQPTRMEFASRR